MTSTDDDMIQPDDIATLAALYASGALDPDEAADVEARVAGGDTELRDAIRARNRGARVDFLDDFSDSQLSEYLRHLEHAEEPRGSAWVRPHGTPGIVWRESSL